ncbi:alpha/beta hydrolase [Nocardioides sp. NPDC127503]|uniref:alpha/beta hydrolase n=1 Tax=Nocardioides sp. NPDC127503 TaxID=3154516 RepID=UPI003323B34C
MTVVTPLRYGLNEADGTIGPRLLACDPPGGARVVEAFGDAATADHIAVVVPGNGHHLGNYFTSTEAHSPRSRGQLLLRTMQAIAPESRSAVVVWLGYHSPPEWYNAITNGPAYAGAQDLANLTHYLPRAAHLTLIGHSYGSTVAGLALASARAEDCVALGSPGMGVVHRSELGSRTRLWAAYGETDRIRLVPQVRLGRLGLGRGPLHPELAATRFGTGDIPGHCGYYAEGSESLLNIARIALGRYDEVTPAGTTTAPVRSTRPARSIAAMEAAA